MSAKRTGLERAIHVLVGIVLAFASLVPITLLAGGLVDVFSAGGDWDWAPSWAVPLVVALSALIAFWCLETAWRLLTGREQDTGGLLSPLVLRIVSFGCTAIAVFMVAKWGLAALWRAAEFVGAAFSLLVLANERVQRKLRRRPPDRRLQPPTRVHEPPR